MEPTAETTSEPFPSALPRSARRLLARSTLRIVDNELNQAHSTRKALFRRLQRLLGMPLLTYFTNFSRAEGIVEASDADVLEALLQGVDTESGLALIISSPGGDGLVAERIIRICRSYSRTGRFTAIVPAKAKSAATLICLGAESIVMGPTSELGPVDPQVALASGSDAGWYSAYNIVNGYQALFKSATEAGGNLDPYLQQLMHYNPLDIEELRSAIQLSDDIAVKALASDMLMGTPEQEIKARIRLFLEPSTKKVHGRAIHRDEAAACGLKVEHWEVDQIRWRTLYELYTRTQQLIVGRAAAKCMETATDSWCIL
jgi:hypothetical protein